MVIGVYSLNAYQHSMKRYLLFTCFVFISAWLNAQNFGNGWIKFDQQYFKFLIPKEGLYRLTFTELNKVGVPLQQIDPQKISIYAKGLEIPIKIEGEQDGLFDSTDFIEFYGTYNDGTLDNILYRNSNEQPHTAHSLYQDSLPYFLTWSLTEFGKRISVYADTFYSGKTKDSSFLFKSTVYFREAWSDGSPFGSGLGQFSEYTDGEGWMGAPNGSNRNLSISTPFAYNDGKDAQFNFSIYGKNSNTTLDGDGFNQEASVFVGPTYSLLFKKKFTGYAHVLDSVKVPFSFLRDATLYRVSSSISGGRLSIAYVSMTYQRRFNLGNNSNFSFRYEAPNRFLEFINYPTAKKAPRVYDYRNHVSIVCVLNGNSVRFSLPSSFPVNELLIIDSSDLRYIPADQILPVTFTPFDFTKTAYDYVILSHVILDSGVQAYKNYRSSPEGGNHNVFTGFFPNLYDQYYYGIHHPMAIRNLINEMLIKQPEKPTYLMLIGKGQTYNRITLETSNRLFEDLVPTFGVPPSDYALTSGLMGTNLEPSLATGRIPCRNNKQIIDYLEKVKLHESAGDQEWRKNVLQLAGGKDGIENAQYRNYLQNFANTLSGKFFGGKRVLLSKADALPVDGSLIQKVQDQINAGVSMVTYFGHGSAQVLEIDIGQSSQYKNQGKYPLFYFNGCALGNSFEQYSVPESFLFEPKVGCISWIASTNFGFSSELYYYGDLFHKNIFYNHYGESIGINKKETIRQYQQPGNDYNRNQCRQLIYLGDPAITLYSPEKPDYRALSSSLKLHAVEGNISDKFVTFRIDNLGKAIDDTLEIEVTLKTQNGDNLLLPIIRKQKLYTSDTVVINLSALPIQLGGLINFEIKLDPENKISELLPLGESNNILSGYVFTAANGIRTLFPLKDQIVSNTQVKLQVQALNVFSTELEVIFEIDTTPEFNSSELHKSAVIKGSNIIEYAYSLPPFDSTDFFWRARLNLPENEGGNWVTNTFRFIYRSPNGWSQGYFEKFGESGLQAISLDYANRTLDFGRIISGNYATYTFGNQASSFRRNIVMDKDNSTLNYYQWFVSNGLRLMAINPDNEDRYSDASKYNLTVIADNWYPIYPGEYKNKYYTIGKKSGVYQFDTRFKADRDSMALILSKIPENYHLFLYSGLVMSVDSWESALYQELSRFGINKIQQNKNGHPYLAKGQKRILPGDAVEVFPDFSNSTLAPEKQGIAYTTQVFPKLTRGSMTSKKIGPASKWNKVYIKINQEIQDSVTIDILGIDENGDEQTLIENADSIAVDLSSIDAKMYRYIQIKVNFYDQTLRNPAQMLSWTALFDGVPEGSIVPVEGFTLHIDTVMENEPYIFKAGFQNISNYDMDSLKVFVSVRNLIKQTTDTLIYTAYRKLVAGDSFHISIDIATVDKVGLNELFVSVNHDKLAPELNFSNNSFIKYFFATKDEKNPVFDVTFDGMRLMNHDIVSPRPTIQILAKDDNPYRFIDQPELFQIKIKYPGKDTFTTLNTTLSEFTFKPSGSKGEKAELIYKPAKLANGDYRMDVQVIDKTQNPSSTNPYSILFTVINEPTVSRVYNYPNPFTTSTRFVFTLTGENIPEVLDIHIFNLTGKLIKTISKSELGHLKIGHNITEYAWDGTDEFGDRLANGVYLYKVVTKLNGQQVELRQDANEAMFKNDMGKLYLMR